MSAEDQEPLNAGKSPNGKDLDTAVYPPCMSCKHLLTIGDQKGEEGWTCRAFPENIPYGILQRLSSHEERTLGQVGEYTYSSKVYNAQDGEGKVKLDWYGEEIRVGKNI